MRSSKSRSRSKSNRQRSMGNIVNRVFDSSGPEGKVRGTPQQIIDKYNQLARDASLGNDRVAAENFQQHAEHYTRMLGEAQREQEARREQQEQQQRERQRDRFDNGNGGNSGNGGNGGDQNTRGQGNQPQSQPKPQSDSDAMQAMETAPDTGNADVIEDDSGSSPQPDLLVDDASGADVEGETGLVETPESQPKPRRPRSRKPKAEAGAGEDVAASDEKPKPKRTRKPKAKSAPAEEAGGAEAQASKDSPEAAE